MQDNLFKKILLNAAKLASGKVMGGVMAFLALLFAGRGLSTSEFGTLMLIYSYVYLIATFGACPCWQVIVHFGCPAYDREDFDATRRSINLAFSIEFIVATLITAIGMLATYFGYLLGILNSYDLFLMTLGACLFIPAKTMNAGYGALRLVDNIRPVALEQALSPALRALFCFIASYEDASLGWYVFAWGAPLLIGELYLLFTGLRCLSKVGLSLRPTLRIISLSKQMPAGVWGLLASGTLTRMVDRVWSAITPLTIARIMGPAQAGLFTLALHVVDALKAPAALLEQSYYPEISRANPKEKEPWKLTLKLCVLSAVIGVVAVFILWIGGKPLISLFGKRYLEASTLIIWLSPALIFMLASLSIEAILFTSGKAVSIVWTEYSAATIYLALLLTMSWGGNIFASALSFVIGQGVLSLMMIGLAVYTYWNRKSIVQPHEQS